MKSKPNVYECYEYSGSSRRYALPGWGGGAGEPRVKGMGGTTFAMSVLLYAFELYMPVKEMKGEKSGEEAWWARECRASK